MMCLKTISHLTFSRILCGICFMPLLVKGLTLTPQGLAVLGEDFRYICNVPDGVDPNTKLTFDRGSEASPVTVCTVRSWGCFQNSTDPRYSCGCLPGQTLDQFYINISHVNLQDDGDWMCQYKGVRSKNTHLNVLYAPSINSDTGRDVREYTSPNIDCSSNITPGNPSSTSYRWTGPDGYSKTGPVLDRTVTRTQGGQYTCTAINTAGLSDTATININVQYAPTIALVATSRRVTEFDRLSIDCSNNITPGNPSSTKYSWTGPGGYNKTGAVLDRTVTRTQGGQYACTATNTVGSDIERLDISVNYPPKITSVPRTRGVIENTSPDIDCSNNIIPGNPSSMSSYRWIGLGGYNAITAKLSKVVTRYQTGRYICIATNTAGLSDTAEVNITVLSSPFAPAISKAYSINETHVSLTWISKYNGGADQHFLVGYQEVGSDEKHLERKIDDPGKDKMVTWNISKLEPDTSYNITLTSVNIYGTSRPVITTLKTLSNSGDYGHGLGVGFCICLAICVCLLFV